MPELDLAPEHLQFVQASLRRHIPDREVWAFGSRVRQARRPTSDLDLVILGDEPVPVATMAALRHELEDSPLPVAIDLVEWATISPTFRTAIRREHIVIQGSSAR